MWISPREGEGFPNDPMSEKWQETTIDGARTRRWSLDAGQCPELKACHISWLGVDAVFSPYRRVRLAPTGSFFLATLAGEGRVWLEGRWQSVKAGSLCLAPPRGLNAFHAMGTQNRAWEIAWIRYEEAPWTKPIVGAGSPLRLAQGAEELGRVLRGLKAEWEGDRDADMVRHWVALAHGQALRRSSAWRSSSRIAEMWETVASDLTMDWKLSSLADACSVSAEHLRRLCRSELGRTPMEQVTFLRIRRAQDLLVATDDKLDAIAPQVGYRSAEVFTRAFLRCTGMTPTQFRRRRFK